MLKRLLTPSLFVTSVLSACQPAPTVDINAPSPQLKPIQAVRLEPVEFKTLPGWQTARDLSPIGALDKFSSACPRGYQTAKEGFKLPLKIPSKQAWKKLCDKARATEQSDRAARQFFEKNFTIYRLAQGDKTQGLLTGYYIPVIEGSLTETEEYRYPVYGAPSGLDAGKPFLTRKQIDSGDLSNKGLEIAWVKDKVMLYFAHVQGSTRMRLPNGRIVLLRFAAKNGQPYVAIGKVLVERGVLQQDKVTMQSIRDWLYAHPDKVQEILEQNPSYVFFRLEKAGSAIVGSHGSPLKIGSLAVDPAYIPLGFPVYLDTSYPDLQGSGVPKRAQSLTVAQDTGTAIKGPLRGDVFFGEGEEGEQLAGYMKSPGTFYLLWPK